MQSWLRFAQHRGKSVTQIKSETSYKDFLLFNKMEEIKFKEYDKTDYYFAQLGLIMASSFLQGKFTLKDFLLDFSEPEPISELDKMNQSIAAWEAATGKKATFKG